MITIDQESTRRIRSPIDFDKMGERYKTDSGIFTFTSPSLWTLEKNLFYLLRYSKEIKFDQKYKMRPDYLSYDEYGTVILAPLLMYVNNVVSVETFNLDNVIIPTYKAVMDLTLDKFSQDLNEMSSIDW